MFSISAAKAELLWDFAASTGSTIQFNGSAKSFEFTGDLGAQWQITDEPVGTGEALTLHGSITGGPFDYGTVTTSGPVQSAYVTGPDGVFTINDGAGHFLTGSIDLVTIDTFLNEGVLDGDLDVNLDDLSYSGSNTDVRDLVEEEPGTVTLSFQFATNDNLTTLSEGSSPSGYTSYSGSILEVPEPRPTPLLSLGAFAALIFHLRRHRLNH